MPALRPDCVEQFAPLFWERNCYSPELQEYQRIAVLVSLDAIHSDLLPQYLERAKQDGRSYLLEHAKRIEGGLAMNEKLSRPQFNQMDTTEKQTLMESLAARYDRERELRSNRKISDIDNEIARISEQNLVLVRLKSKGYVDSALYLSQMDEIDRKLRELRKLRRRLLEAAGEDRQIHDTERMMEYLEDGPEWLDEVPAELFGELIERIIIISPERLKFRLLNGMELAENIERTVR